MSFHPPARIELPLKAIGFTCKSPEYLLEREQAENAAHTLRHMTHQLRTWVVAEKQSPYVLKQPATWWDMLKLSLAPWFQKLFPVRYTELKIDVETVYPFLKTQIPQDLTGDRVTVLIAGHPAGSFLSDIFEDKPVTMEKWNHEIVPRLFSDPRCVDGRSCPFCKRTLSYS